MSSLFQKYLRSHLQTKNIKKLGTSIGTNALNGALMLAPKLVESCNQIRNQTRIDDIRVGNLNVTSLCPISVILERCQCHTLPQQYRVRYYRMRHVLYTQRIKNTLYSMQVNVLPDVGFTEPLRGTTNEVNGTKVNTLRYKSVPWNNNILSVAFPVCRLPITDYLLPTTYLLLVIPEYRLPTQRLPSVFVSIYDCLVVWRLAAAWLKTRFTFFLLFAHKNSYILMRWRHSQKKQKRGEPPRARVRRKYTKYTKI